MNRFWRCYRAERIKWRRGWTLLATILVPFCQVGFLFLIVWFAEDRASLFGTGFHSWYKVNFIAWNLVSMPIVVALTTSLSWDLEAATRGWNHLFVMPVSRNLHFLVKFASHASLTLLAQTILGMLLIGGGLVLRINVPALSMGEVDLSLLLHYLTFSITAALPVVGLHTWFPSRYSSLGSSLGLALVGSWFTFQLSEPGLFICLLPWGLASQITNIALRARLPTQWMYVSSILSATLCLLLGMYEFKHRSGMPNR
jgi:hypothetical protein